MRFNSNGHFNVPFNHKKDRFRKSYITKITNQIGNIRRIIRNKDWTFIHSSWEDTLNHAHKDDFVYLDPPYIGRHTDYFNTWTENDAKNLAKKTLALNCGFALSMWKENKYRVNDHLLKDWNGVIKKEFSHFYHIGSTESLRNKMTEVLAIKPEYSADLELLAS
jgi:DNA adenine methylase